MIKTYFLLLIIVVSLTGCFGQNNATQQQNGEQSPTNITDDDKIIETHGRLENIERLDNFVNHVQNKKTDSIRMIRYTTEGDPIYHDLAYDGNNLIFTVDSTEDKFGSGEVTSYTCKSIIKVENNTETKYTLQGCPNAETKDFFTITHDIEKQDYFAFELKYKGKIIDTKHQILSKQLQNGEVKTINDFALSTEELNNIYKELILANYLEEKQLSKECEGNPDAVYELKIWINSGNRHYEWSACDQSEDGKEMTELAENIIALLQKNATYRAFME